MSCQICGKPELGGWLCRECHAKWLQDPSRHHHGDQCRDRGEATNDRIIHVYGELLGRVRTHPFWERLQDGFAMLEDDQ